MIYMDSAELLAIEHLRWAGKHRERGGSTPLSPTEVIAVVGLIDRLTRRIDELERDSERPTRARDLSFMREEYQQHKDKKRR